MSDYSIFKPKSTRSIFNDYPELRLVPEFKPLSNDDMLFVWYYACESSPHFRITKDRIRVEKALEDSYFRNGKKHLMQTDKERYLTCMFPEKIRLAIEAMSQYKVGPRVRAKMLLEKGFENIEHILNIDASDEKHFKNKDGEVDFTKKKAFMDTLAKATDLMPSLISQLEKGFHVTEDKDKNTSSTFEDESFMDNYHDEQKD